jgi:putative NADH-flavin reductase
MSKVVSVLGGTGRVGREVCRAAHANGHIVIGLGRDAAARVTVPGVQMLDGEATDAATVDRAVAPADCVVSVLGHVKGSPRDLLVQAMRHTIAAMERHNVRRIVMLTRASSPPAAATTRLGPLLQRVLPRTIAQDHAEAVALLQDSDLDWTVVRARRLVADLPGTGRLEADGEAPGTAVAYPVAASFLLECAVSNRYLHATPLLTQSEDR